MLDRLMKYVCVGMTVLTLVAAGPGALTLALTVPTETRVGVQRAVDQLPSLQTRLLYVQEDGAPVPPAAETPADAVPPTETQEVVIEYGNWVQTLLKPIRDVGLALIPFVGLWVVSLLPAFVRLVVPASRVNEFLEQAWLNAFNSVERSARGKTASVKLTNSFLTQMAVYTLTQAPVLVKQAADNLPQLLQKLVARIPPEWVPPGWTSEQAVKAVSPAAIRAAAARQGVKKSVDVVLKDDGSFQSAILKGFGS